MQKWEPNVEIEPLGTYKRCADILGVSLSDIFSDRSATEDRLVEVFRRISPQKHEQLMSILEVAQDLPPEGGAEPNQTDDQ
jgi:hypothetical protein